MRYIKRYFEDIVPSYSDDAKRLLPKELEIITSNGHYKLKNTDFIQKKDAIDIVYHHNTAEKSGDITSDGEPDYLCFDINMSQDTNGLRMSVDITYGDAMMFEFTIESPNKVRLGHYNGIHSKVSPETHFFFTDDSLKSLVDFFNSFSTRYSLVVDDFKFLDSDSNSFVPDVQRNGLSGSSLGSIKLTPLSKGENILLLDNTKGSEDIFLKNLINYLKFRGINYKVCRSIDELESNSKSNIIGIISSGSTHRISQDESNDNIEMQNKANSLFSCPMLGICFGMQSMSKINGSEIISGDKEVHDKVVLDEYDKSHPLFKDVNLDKLQVSFCYNDYPESVPNGFDVISKVGGRIAGISNLSDNRFGLLFHPEDLEQTHPILDNYIKLCRNGFDHEDEVKTGKFERVDSYKIFSNKRKSPN